MQYRQVALDDYLQQIPPEEQAQVKAYFDNMDQGFAQGSIQYSWRASSQTMVLRVEPISHTTQPTGFLWEGYTQNVTELVSQRTQTQRLSQAINAVSEAILALKVDGSIMFCNHAFRTYSGITAEEEQQRVKIYQLPKSNITQEWWDQWVCQIQQAERTTFTHNLWQQDNVHPWVSENYTYRVHDPFYGDLIWIFARDISERLKWEKQMVDLHAMVSSILNHLPGSLFVKDGANDFRYLFCNQAACTLLEVSNPEQVIGRQDFERTTAERAQEIRTEDQYIVEHRTRIKRVDTRQNEQGEKAIWEHIKFYSEKQDGSPLIIGVGWDVTSRVQLEKELQLAKEKAEEAGRLKSAFLAKMRHEIRTPLNAILGFSHIIAETDEVEERRNMYTIVETNTDRLLSLINEILDLSKIEAGMLELSFKPVNLNVLCNEVLNANLFRCPGNVIFTFDATSPRLITRTDSNRLFQVFSNLITNAFKFTTEGEIQFGYHLNKRQIICHVRDSGIGISPEQQATIFHRFVKGNDFAQGTGLGLPICKVLVEKMGGTIHVESEVGKGTCFIFTLPYDPPVGAQRAKKITVPIHQSALVQENAVSEENTASEENEEVTTILVGEEEPHIFPLLQSLYAERYFLISASDGVEIVTLFEQYRPQMVLLAPQLKDMNAEELIPIIKEVEPTTHIALLTTARDELPLAEDSAIDLWIPHEVTAAQLDEQLRPLLPH
ncbi:MAG: ATP-binding protein [Alistipes sp.]|nr:ATP-binding protein [Alistipes sp.]